jgi:hypothetical protein
MVDYVISEPLCVLNSNFGKLPKANIISIFAEFYAEDEIVDAKKALLEIADNLSPKSDEIKKIKMRVGDGKLRRDIEDLFLVFTVLDNRKHPMPRFLAADSNRIPTVKEMDFCKVTASITDLSQRITEISASVSTLVDVSVSSAAGTASGSGASKCGDTNGASGFSGDGGASYAGVAAALKDQCVVYAPNPWMKIVNGQAVAIGPDDAGIVKIAALKSALPPASDSAAPVRRMVTGTKQVASGSTLKIKASSGNKAWHLFIGKLGCDTTESDIKDYLVENNVDVLDVNKLKAVKSWQEKSSAFRVVVNFKCKDTVMNPDLWPDNVDVRDWYFKPK